MKSISEIEKLLKKDKEAWRTEARKIITQTTRDIVEAFVKRQEMMRLIAESKTWEWKTSLLQLWREYELLDMFHDLSEKEWIDPELSEILVWFLMSAWKERQRRILQRDWVFIPEEIDRKILKENLLELTKHVANSYDNYWESFSATRESMKLEKVFIEKMIKKIPLSERGFAVDLWCADWRISRYLAENDFDKVVWIDISPDFIERAKEKGNYENLEYLNLDLDKWLPFEDESVDVIVANFWVGSEIDNLIQEVNRVLKDNGRALITFYNKDSILNKWWLPWKPSMWVVVNYESNIIEVPVKSKWKTEVFKLYAKPFNIWDIHKEMENTSLDIKNLYSFPSIIQLMPNMFFKDKEKIETITEHELLHSDIRPYLGFYLTVEFKKIKKN